MTAFDPGLAAIGAIEPDFEERIVGWENEEVLVEDGWEPVMVLGSETPVGFVSPDSMPWRLEPITPRPIIERVLVWRDVP